MKANAPEKIYILKHSDYSDRRILNAFTEKETNNDIEYTRTDAFIEKACDAYCKTCKMPNCNGKDCKFIENFKNYMEGE